MLPAVLKQYSRFASGLINTCARIAGRRCAACTAVITDHQPGIIFCPECIGELQVRRGGFCGMCARIYALEDESTHFCLECRNRPFSWHGMAFFSVYQGLLKDMITRFKFNGDLGLGRALGHLLLEAASFHAYENIDFILPVPLHPVRLKARGFNQSLELSRILGRRINLPVLKDVLIKTKHTSPQSSMDRKLRLKSLKNVFEVRGNMAKHKNVLLVDDIMTTGSTLDECTKALLKAGASEVRIVFLARAA